MMAKFYFLIFLILNLVYNSNTFAQDHIHELNENIVRIMVNKVKKNNDTTKVFIHLYKIKNNTPVTLNDLKMVHTQKIHLLIIDNNLEDYIHVHPMPTKEKGI